MARWDDLVKQAAGLGIDVTAFDALKTFGLVVAEKALETAVKTKQTALDQVDHLALFNEAHGHELNTLFDALALVRVLADGYNAKNGAKLALNLDAESLDNLIVERKRGPRSTISRDIPAFAQRVKGSTVFSMKLRLKESREGEYHNATLLAEGKVKNGGNQTHDSINDWGSYVYDLALQAGKRETATCNVWVSVELARKDGSWVKLGEAYEEVMSSQS